MISSTPAPLHYRRPSIVSAACPWCERPVLGLLTVVSAALRFVVAAVTVVVLASLFTATAEAQVDPEPCSGGGYNPVPVDVAVTSVPIVVESTAAEYFVLYVRHDLDADTTEEIPVLVKRGAAGTTPLAENVEALPKERYRVKQFLIDDPTDVDGDCIDDITELEDPVGKNPVNPTAAIALSNGAVTVEAVPNSVETFDGGSVHQLSHL